MRSSYFVVKAMWSLMLCVRVHVCIQVYVCLHMCTCVRVCV